MTTPGVITVACAADERFAMPLAVTIRSLLDHLAPDWKLNLFLLNGGISERFCNRLYDSWDSRRLSLNVVRPETSRLSQLRVSHHVNHLTYYRLLLPELLPNSLDKVLYLDSDLLVRHDVRELWELPLGEAWALAVQDCAAPYFDSTICAPNIERCQPYLAAVRPIANYREQGFSPASPYLNGGVLIINLNEWRQNDATERMLSCLHKNSEFVLFWDQYALNVLLCDRWKQLDLRWNQGSHVYRYPDSDHSPFSAVQYEQIKNDPYIVHFTSPEKPWHALGRHPFREEYFQVLDRTDWNGWRPTTADAVREYFARFRKQLKDAIYIRVKGRSRTKT